MNIPNVEKISKYVGREKDTGIFYCLGCLESGFLSPAHVNGHQSICPKRHPERQISDTTPTTNIPYPISANLGGGGGGGGTPYLPPIQDIKTQNVVTLPIPDILFPKTNSRLFFQKIDMLEQEVNGIKKIVTNEIPHEIATRQQIGGIGNFIEANKNFLIGIGIGIAIGWILNEMLKPKYYSSPVYNRLMDNGRRGKGSSFGSALANRAAGKAIDYGLNEIFKKR
jgi:uncharacterized protein YneR